MSAVLVTFSTAEVKHFWSGDRCVGFLQSVPGWKHLDGKEGYKTLIVMDGEILGQEDTGVVFVQKRFG